MNRVKLLLIKHKEFISYGFFGFLTTIFNIGLFWFLTKIDIKYYIANIITLVIVKTLCYFVNKIFVFKSKCKNNKELLSEITKYIFSRIFTMGIDYFGLIFLVEVCSVNELLGKLIVLVIVVIINYFMCKKYVYKNKNVEDNNNE